MVIVTDGTKVYPPHAFAPELDTACQAALRAGRALMQYHNRHSSNPEKHETTPRAAARASEQLIRSSIKATFPRDALLCESAQAPGERLEARRLWLVDPLDGAAAFAEGAGDFSVMIALLHENALRVGVIYEPVHDVLYYALAGAGAYRSNGHGPEPLTCVPSKNGTRVIATRTPADPVVLRLCEEDGFTGVDSSEAVGVQCVRIAEGARAIYVQPASPVGEWHTAAPELILTEAGACVTDCFGRSLTYNKPVPLQPAGLLAAHPTTTFRIIPTLTRILNGKGTNLQQRRNGK